MNLGRWCLLLTILLSLCKVAGLGISWTVALAPLILTLVLWLSLEALGALLITVSRMFETDQQRANRRAADALDQYATSVRTFRGIRR